MKRALPVLLLAASLTSQAQGSLNSGLLGRFLFDNSLVDATGNIGNTSNTNVAYGADSHGQADAALRLTGAGEVSSIIKGRIRPAARPILGAGAWGLTTGK